MNISQGFVSFMVLLDIGLEIVQNEMLWSRLIRSIINFDSSYGLRLWSLAVKSIPKPIRTYPQQHTTLSKSPQNSNHSLVFLGNVKGPYIGEIWKIEEEMALDGVSIVDKLAIQKNLDYDKDVMLFPIYVHEVKG
ncbi:hypothetical protein PanWU01x14_030090 [Parasponia andersonii]|uniref:Uncharacterized protein n=1 Tax=Parasponia andersonii TaxID=3476 RepID=A0A2P5DUN2_PARAD|nr:hypothetical protein PanWU01x14_030090 [Parasponia andersonii]